MPLHVLDTERWRWRSTQMGQVVVLDVAQLRGECGGWWKGR